MSTNDVSESGKIMDRYVGVKLCVLSICCHALLFGAAITCCASEAAFPSYLDNIQTNDTKGQAAAWDSVDLNRATQAAGSSGRSSMDDLLHWAIRKLPMTYICMHNGRMLSLTIY